MDNTMTFEQTLKKNGSLVFTNVGISMRPLIREGKDVIHIKPVDGKIKKYDVVLFTRPHITGRGHYTLHRVIKINKDGTYRTIGDNCITGETVKRDEIIGILDAVIRNGKTVKSTDFSYRLYVIFWCAPYHLRIFAIKTSLFIKRVFGKLRRMFSGR